MNVIYTNRSGPHIHVLYPWKTKDELLAESDYVSLHMPAVKGAPPVIDAEAISKMKDGASRLHCVTHSTQGSWPVPGLTSIRKSPARTSAFCTTRRSA